MQFKMKTSRQLNIDKLVKNLNDRDFKYLSEEFSDEQLKLVKEKGIYSYEYVNSFNSLLVH